MVEPTEENTVFIGSKHPGKYREAVMTQLLEGEDSVFLKARGDSISSAHDVAESLKKRISGLSIEDMESGSEELDADEDEESDDKVDVSTVTITLALEGGD